jgi:hypothetical protein
MASSPRGAQNARGSRRISASRSRGSSPARGLTADTDGWNLTATVWLTGIPRADLDRSSLTGGESTVFKLTTSAIGLLDRCEPIRDAGQALRDAGHESRSDFEWRPPAFVGLKGTWLGDTHHGPPSGKPRFEEIADASFYRDAAHLRELIRRDAIQGGSNSEELRRLSAKYLRGKA